MRTISHLQNPFLMLMDLESVVQAMEESDRLQSLNRRICRPLDRALLNMKAKEAEAQADLVEDGEDLPDDFGHAH